MKVREVTYHVVDAAEFDRLAGATFHHLVAGAGPHDYSCRTVEDWESFSEHTYDVWESTGEESCFSDRARQGFAAGQWPSAEELLNELCRLKLIESGAYLIEVRDY